jgi:SMC interacting uncharacterized protein involved in chromosome segregation
MANIETEYKDREQFLSDKLEKLQKKSKELMTELCLQVAAFSHNETQFETREQQMKQDLNKYETAMEQFKIELQSKADHVR